MRIESSIMTSLSELRSIEQQRIADERATHDRERKAALDAAHAAELARVQAIEARVRAEREERMAIEAARVEAERDARLRVEAHAASERARHAAMLEERRLVEELEIKRAEVAKKRPTWMLAVTGVAAVAAIGLALFAIDSSRDTEQARAQQRQAVLEKDEAKRELRASSERLAGLIAEVEQFDVQLAALQKQLDHDQTEADRKRTANEMAAADARRRETNERIRAEKLRLEKLERNEVIDVSKCVGTAVGCLKQTP